MLEKEDKLRFLNIVKEPITIATFPSHFQTLIKIRDLLNNEEASILEISRVIQLEPFITVRLLNIANSRPYSRGRVINTIHEAVLLLGLNLVKRIVLAISLSQLIQSKPVLVNSEITRNVWLNTIYMAAAGAILAKRIGVNENRIIFRASLINLGVFYLIYQVSLDETLSPKINELKPFIYDCHTDVAMRILDYFDISPLVYRTFKTYYDESYNFFTQPNSIPEVLYSAYLLAYNKHDWLAEFRTVKIHAVDEQQETEIESRYQELRELFD